MEEGFIHLWNIIKKGLGYWDDHDNAPHLGLSRLRFLEMCSGCKSALVSAYIQPFFSFLSFPPLFPSTSLVFYVLFVEY